MTPLEITFAFAGLAIAGLVKGATGMGFSTTALPIIALSIGLERAMALVLLSSLSSNISVMVSAGEFRATLFRFRWLFLALFPGLAAGLWGLAWISPDRAAHFLGAIILGYVIYTFWKPALAIPQGAERMLNIPVGILNGFINGLTGSQIVPVVPYGLSLNLSPHAFIQLTNIAFTLASLVMLVGLRKIGFLDTGTFLVSAVGIIPGLLGVGVGTRMRRAITPETFRKIALAVLGVLSVLLMVGR
ncbi:MAG: TSUP family transporter [Hyphomicrobiaceae bacterium]